jgi:hypothetical protein
MQKASCGQKYLKELDVRHVFWTFIYIFLTCFDNLIFSDLHQSI